MLMTVASRTAANVRSMTGGRMVSRLRRCCGAILVAYQTWSARRRGRRQLAELDDFRLRDIGLTRAELQEELFAPVLPFWRRRQRHQRR